MFDKSKTLALGCDQGGYALKEFIKIKLAESGYSVRDFGTFSPDSVDYPDFAHPVASAVNNGQFPMALLICGSGNGVCMTANKYAGIRAALCWLDELGALARQHNNANVLSIGSAFVDEERVRQMLEIWLWTEFPGEDRHARRIKKLDE